MRVQPAPRRLGRGSCRPGPGTRRPERREPGPEVTAEAGSTVNLSCNLTGPRLSWWWVPRYPRCAGGSGGIQTIYTVTAAGAANAPEGRFQKRLRLLMDQGTRTSVLELRPLHMNDSGAFFCASPSQEAPLISMTVTPGCPAGASITAVPQEPVGEGASVSLSCSPCGAQGPTSPPAGGATWWLNGKPLPDSAALRILRAKVTIEGFSSRWEGLWSCHLPGDPPRSGGYCLERHPGAHGTQESPPPGPTPLSAGRVIPAPILSPGPSPTSLLPLVGGCAGAALGLVLVGIVAVICRRRRRARAASATPRVTEMDRKSERAAEQPGPPAPGGAEQKPPPPNPHPDGEGPEGISYSTLHFQAPRGAGAGARAETGPATIYSELATRHG
ncbi:uncharacterized protein LOC123345827 [Mauremys mutica]|uniref:uncharacterized protein LOC123345827 n=1 Tax=Mauremys mutica TaxID=74926 RepID=UPI001D165E5C|nr:uncharacterized protein LOC123345827 [Mauremys mutica]